MYFDLRSTKQSSKSRENSIRFDKSAQTLWQAPTVKCSAEQHGAVQFSEGLQLPLNGEESIRNSNRSINMDLAKLSVVFYQLRQVDSLVHYLKSRDEFTHTASYARCIV